MKKINKSFIKYFSKVIVSIFLILYLFFAPTTIFKTLRASQNLSTKQIEVEYNGILELWNIDTFEGGSVSRTRFLEKQALKFESQNKGVYIMVNNMSPEQLSLNLQSGKKPDIVSFGIGVGDELITSLIPLYNTYNVRDDLIDSGKCNGIQYSIPYILGGYLIINDTEFQNNNLIKLGFGGKDYNSTIVNLALNNFTMTNEYKNNMYQDSFTAYDRYLTGQFDCLLGTQRDLYRITNRIEKGNMTSKNFAYLSGFTDLIQHIGICTTDATRTIICEKFIKHLLLPSTQQEIANISMFSVLNTNIYQSNEFYEMEQALLKPLKTLSVFLTDEKINEIKALSQNVVSGNNEDLKKLKSYLV